MGNYVIQPLLNKSYCTAVKATGVYIWDKDGNRYLDGSSGAITCSIGHSHPLVIQSITDQMKKLQFVYRSQFASEESEELAEKICNHSLNNEYKHVFFVSSGTEAMETAMKIAWQYWQECGQPKKTFFLSRRISYHGITVGALSLSGHPIRRKKFEGLLEKYPSLYADLEEDILSSHIEEAKKVIESVGAEHIAAFVAEPIVGAAGGVIIPPDGYYEKMASLCKSYNILFIADEVMTGLGRTGEWFGLNHWNTTADIVAIGKSLGAGYAPIAATLMKNHIIQAIKNGSGSIMAGHTYTAHPLSCKAATTVLSVIEDEELVSKVKLKGTKLLNELIKMQQKFPFIKKVRGKGFMLGIEFIESLIREKVILTAYLNGLLLYPSAGGKFGNEENCVIVAPPFTITEEETDEMLEKLYRTLQSI